MKIEALHNWRISVPQAIDIQRSLAGDVSRRTGFTGARFIAGLDISVNRVKGMARGAVVVLSYPELLVVETEIVEGKLEFPYVPGLLSFREAPLMLAACQQLNITPDLFLIDGQGIAHPRRVGLASHLGLFLNAPTIGCAKSLLCGSCEMPADEKGSYAEIIDRDETIGAALRTRLRTKPVFVSIGHKIDLEDTIRWVLVCCRGYRLPEPTRLAHLAAGGNLNYDSELSVGERCRR